MEDCLEESVKLYNNRNYIEALQCINDSGLDVNNYEELYHLKVECLIDMDQLDLAHDCIEEYTIRKVNEFIKDKKFTTAMDEVAKCGLDKSRPNLVKALEHCLEEELVSQCLTEAHKFYKKGNFEEALRVIDDSGVLLEMHPKLWGIKVDALKALGRDMEAYKGANFLWLFGHKMSAKLIQMIGDVLVHKLGHEETLMIYKCFAEDYGISKADQKLYRKWAKEIHTNRHMIKDFAPQRSPEANHSPEAEKMVKTIQKEENIPIEQTVLDISPQEKIETNKPLTKKTDEEDSSSIATLKVPLKFQFTIGKYLGGNLREGNMNCDFFTIPKSFIEPKLSQTKNIDLLRLLGCGNDFVVTIDYIIEQSSLSFMVGEPVVPIDYFFQLELKSFRLNISHETTKADWWKQIANCFNQIFGDVMHGLTYLDSLGHGCGDLKNSIYVSGEGRGSRGKILPLLDFKNDRSPDVTGLIKKMKAIITLPFPEDIIDESYELPHYLARLLSFFTPDKLKHVPCWWLYKYPHFWSTKECLQFILDVHVEMKARSFKEDRLDKMLKNICSDITASDWGAAIYFKDLKMIFLNHTNVKKYDVERPIEMVRYMIGVTNHVNDDRYYFKRVPRIIYFKEDVEPYFRRFFPNVYVDLYEALFIYARDIEKQVEKDDALKAMKKMSSLYFAKEETQDKVKGFYQPSQIKARGSGTHVNKFP
ncbi:uncharacterized protein LOC141647623 [Silene latifolia]|uniref:uncharacterized protein LOC141647623 n=1 Tax=Silene latifolia TaxID=37657 RepID=UPI003D786C45